MNIPLSKIGPVQLRDVTRSGIEINDGYARTCTVLQGNPPTSSIGDDVPYRIAKLYGGSWETWNRQFVVQVAGCPLNCWYCYVDNLKTDEEVSLYQLVKNYADFKILCPDINVFHLMGGCPGRFAPSWPLLRNILDGEGFGDDILLTDVILVEDYLYGSEPWEHIPHRTVVSACLKGTNWQNFQKNTSLDLFFQTLRELAMYTKNPQVYFALIEWDDKDSVYLQRLLGDKINWLKVREYEVVKKRKKT